MEFLAIGIQTEEDILVISRTVEVEDETDTEAITNQLHKATGEKFERILVVKNDTVVNDFNV